MSDPFAREIIGYLFKLALAGLGSITAVAIAVQLYFRRAIKHEAGRALVKQRVNQEDTGAKVRLLERFEKDLADVKAQLAKSSEVMKDELEATRKALAHTTHSNAEMSREHRYLQGKIDTLNEEITELRKIQPKFLSQMSKFIVSLDKMKSLQAQAIPKSGGLTKVGAEEAD